MICVVTFWSYDESYNDDGYKQKAITVKEDPRTAPPKAAPMNDPGETATTKLMNGDLQQNNLNVIK